MAIAPNLYVSNFGEYAKVMKKQNDKITSAEKSAKRRTGAKTSQLSATLDGWAMALTVDSQTLKRKLVRAGAEVVPRKLYAASEIVAALLGDAHYEKVRNLKLDADKKERQAKQDSRELVRMVEVEALLSKVLQPMREQLLSLPERLCVECNSASPDTARRALEAWADATLKMCRDTFTDAPAPKEK
jgi:hypothetical protein